MREIKVTNTLTGKKEPLTSKSPGKITFYSCGPTVYNLIHIGNLRGGLVADMVFRYLSKTGYEVTYVRNYTDVDDKIIQKGLEENLPADEIAHKYTLEVERDFRSAGMLEPTHKTTVTTHIPEIIRLIQQILANGLAYSTADGEVFFAIDRFQSYGKLSHRKLEDLVVGARVEVNEKKRNPLDFSLWKPAKPGEPFWESPWCKGRPGWHIECSAMASKWLGDQLDLHHGGEDLIFPHHENEIAQSEAASQKEPFVKVWIHHAFVNMAKEKMSKSLGNILSARAFLTRFSGETARFLLLSTHYRSPIEYSDLAVDHALQGLNRIYEAKQKAVELKKHLRRIPDLQAEGTWGSFLASSEKTREEIDEHFANDFNAAGALGALFTLIREFNRVLTEPKASATPSAYLGAEEVIKIIEGEIGAVLGIGVMEPQAALAELTQIKIRKNQTTDLNPLDRITEAEIGQFILERNQAREARDFKKADLVRQELLKKGVLLKDTPAGTQWEYTG